MAPSETTVSYNVATDDIFPELTGIDAYVTLDCSAVFNSSDGTILLNNSTKYLITAKPGSGTLTVNYEVNRPLLKKSGSPSVPINATWLLGDSPPITVYDDGTVKITVIIHGHLNGQVITVGNGSATPSSVTWSNWETKDITLSANANAQNGQTIQIQTATKYVVYFTVKVELIGIQSFTQDSPTKEVLGSSPIQSDITVIPPPLSMAISVNPTMIQSTQTSTITTRVAYGGNPISGATVTLYTDSGGTLSPTSGNTDSNGYFTATFTAPTVTTQTTIRITANATKTGYFSAQQQTQITVNPSLPQPQPAPQQSDLTLWIYIAVVIIILIAIGGGIAIIRRKSQK